MSKVIKLPIFSNFRIFATFYNFAFYMYFVFILCLCSPDWQLSLYDEAMLTSLKCQFSILSPIWGGLPPKLF